MQENASCLCVMFFFCLISHKCFDSPGGSQNCAVIFKMLYAKALTFLLIRSKMRLRNQSFHVAFQVTSFQHPRTTFWCCFNQPNKRRQDLANVLAILKGSSGWSTIRRVPVVLYIFVASRFCCMSIKFSMKCYFLFSSSLIGKLCPFVSGTKLNILLNKLKKKKWEH